MSSFLRDESLQNLAISEDALRKINEDILDVVVRVNDQLKEKYEGDELKRRFLFRSYIIRFDGKGFRLFEFEKAIRYFQDAHKVERFLFVVESIESLSRTQGKSVELRFDALDLNNCTLVVQDDDGNWVDSVFCKLKERLTRYKNANRIVRNRWVPFLIQLIGVIVGFLLSLWVAIKFSPLLSIDNAAAFCFIIAFLLFSNIWTVVFDSIIKLLDYFWPNISFKAKGTIHWLVQALISTAFISIFLFVLGKLFLYFGGIIKSIIK